MRMSGASDPNFTIPMPKSNQEKGKDETRKEDGRMNRVDTFVVSVMEQMQENNFSQKEVEDIIRTLRWEVQKNRKRVEDERPFTFKRGLLFR